MPVRRRLTERTLAVLLVAALLVPSVHAYTVIVGTSAVQTTDLERRNYVAVTAGNADASLGDLVVVTTAACGTTVCQRDVWFRWMHAPTSVPTIAESRQWAETYHADARANCGTSAANVQNGCLMPERPFPGFGDAPVATDPALDEADAFTDGRFVVYSVAVPGGDRDVWRFDARNPTRPPVPIATTDADETPFGVSGDEVGVRVGLADGRVRLDLVNSTRALALATVNATNGATMAKTIRTAGTAASTFHDTHVAWEAGNTLFYRYPNGTIVAKYDAGAVFQAPSFSGSRLAYIRAVECSSGPTCFAGTAPNRVYEVHVTETVAAFVHGANWYDAGKTRALAETVSDAATSSRPVAVVQHHDITFWKTLKGNGRETFGAVQVPMTGAAQTINYQGGRPCGWAQAATADVPAGLLGMPAASYHYVFQVDYGSGCGIEERPAVRAYAKAQCGGAGQPAAPCYGFGGVGPMNPQNR